MESKKKKQKLKEAGRAKWVGVFGGGGGLRAWGEGGVRAWGQGGGARAFWGRAEGWGGGSKGLWGKAEGFEGRGEREGKGFRKRGGAGSGGEE